MRMTFSDIITSVKDCILGYTHNIHRKSVMHGILGVLECAKNRYAFLYFEPSLVKVQNQDT
jgi:hypothetical protein